MDADERQVDAGQIRAELRSVANDADLFWIRLGHADDVSAVAHMAGDLVVDPETAPDLRGDEACEFGLDVFTRRQLISPMTFRIPDDAAGTIQVGNDGLRMMFFESGSFRMGLTYRMRAENAHHAYLSAGASGSKVEAVMAAVAKRRGHVVAESEDVLDGPQIRAALTEREGAAVMVNVGMNPGPFPAVRLAGLLTMSDAWDEECGRGISIRPMGGDETEASFNGVCVPDGARGRWVVREGESYDTLAFEAGLMRVAVHFMKDLA